MADWDGADIVVGPGVPGRIQHSLRRRRGPDGDPGTHRHCRAYRQPRAYRRPHGDPGAHRYPEAHSYP